MNIGIIGNGFVGKATQQLESSKVNLLCYDINPELCKPAGCTLNDLVDKCDIIFISVPTPMNQDGSCHLKILDSVVEQISKICDLNDTLVVVRCTVPPGTADRLNCYYMPEFLTERNYLEDFKNNSEWVFGLKGTSQDNKFKESIKSLLTTSVEHGKIKYSNHTFLKNKEAEMVKLFRNTFLATKVAFCNEIYDFCQAESIDYSTMIKHACNDSRIGHSHTMVPGHDGKRGYGGTCFPKDIKNLYNLMKVNNQDSYILKNVIDRNEIVDRKEKDWLENKGRAVV